jgi:hypothetical protein
LEFSGDDLTRHLIGFGSTGSGKTTGLINPLLQQLIAWKASDQNLRVGLLVLDPKADDSSAKIAEYARAAGRERDLLVLSAHGNAWYDLLGGLERLDQVEAYAQRLLSGTRDMGQDNHYWTETRNGLVETALILLLANGTPVHFSDAVSFMQAWWFSSDQQAIEPKVSFVQKLLSGADLTSLTRRRLELALLEVQNWSKMDGRTKELHKSCLSNALRPLLSAAAQGFFAPKSLLFRPEAVLEGKILIVSCDAILHPALSRLIFRVVRRDFYAAVQSRPVTRPEENRLCGLIADELPLSVMPEDVEALSVIRARNGFVVAACQSLTGLDEVLGMRGREALLANFNSVFFFASRESALDAQALLTLGTKEVRPRMDSFGDLGDLQLLGQAGAVIRQPVCPPGSLARLKQHQAFVKLADGSCTEWPVWLQPSFFNPSEPPRPTVRDDLAEAVNRARAAEAEATPAHPANSSFIVQMHRQGHRLFLTPNVVAAAWQVCVTSLSRNRMLTSARSFTIRGLEALPSCWLLGMLCWLDHRPGLAEAIERVSVRSGVLWPSITAPACWLNEGVKTLPEALNLAIYPSLWRPLKHDHLMRLMVERPDLREELQSLPQALQPL